MLFDAPGQPEEADAEFRTALRLAPNDPNVINNYAVYLCQNGRTDEGVKQFEEAATNALYRTPEAAYTNAGVCLRAAKRDEEARAAVREGAADAKPNFADAVLQLAEPGSSSTTNCRRRARCIDAYFGQLRRRLRICCCSACASRARRRIRWARSATRASCSWITRLRPDRARWPLSTATPAEVIMTREGGSVGIGARLRAARERRGLTVLQAAEKLHVDAKRARGTRGRKTSLPWVRTCTCAVTCAATQSCIGESLRGAAGPVCERPASRCIRISRASRARAPLGVLAPAAAGAADGRGLALAGVAVVGVERCRAPGRRRGGPATGGGGLAGCPGAAAPRGDTAQHRLRRERPPAGRRPRAAAPPAPGRPSA